MVTMCLDEAAKEDKNIGATIFFDVAKFYGSINIEKLINAALKLGYPPQLNSA